MIYHDYACDRCGHQHERNVKWNDYKKKLCPGCNKLTARRIYNPKGAYLGNQDTTWLKTAPINVVDPESKDPIDIAFRKNPTRDNRDRWMKHHGKIEYEPGMPLKPPPTDLSTLRRKVIEAHKKRSRIEIRSR